MKKGFTLVELLIVVVVLVTLMTITLRIGGIGDETSRRNRTTNRMQRLENCLSGYYAVYGSYPPVKLHGSRNYLLPVDKYGLQDESNPRDELIWENVRAACRSQPVAMCYPFQKNKEEYVEAVSKMRRETATTEDPLNDFVGLVDNSIVQSKGNKRSWRDVQIFKFGLMSYLLPRYIIVMGGGESTGNIDSSLFDAQEQWSANNQLPCRFDSGVPYDSWSEVINDVVETPWKISVMPSQAACARWLPNLEGSVATSFEREIYGIKLRATTDDGGANGKWEIYDASANGSQGQGQGGGGQNYAIQMMTMVDGWGNDFYYYSLPPHQSYMLWSGGPNGRTFPPWIDMKDVDRKYHTTIQDWVSDDFLQMSN